MPRLVLINGAPGCGKTTQARLLAERTPLALALNVDDLKHALGQWQRDLKGSATHARTLAIAVIREQLALGHDVVLGSYISAPGFIDELAADAADLGADFREILLTLPADRLADRLVERAQNPSRPEHEINAKLVTPADAPRLAEKVAKLALQRPRAEIVDASGSVEQTQAALVAVLDAPRED